MDKDQKRRYSKQELELIRSSFGGDKESNIYDLRSHFLQLTELKTEFSPDQLTLLKKHFIPTIQEDVPLMQQADIYNTLGKIHEIPPDALVVHIEVKDVLCEYLGQRFDALLGIEALEQITLSNLKDKDKDDRKRVIDMMAFIEILGWIEMRCSELKGLANEEVLTPEEEKKRARMNSTK